MNLETFLNIKHKTTYTNKEKKRLSEETLEECKRIMDERRKNKESK